MSVDVKNKLIIGENVLLREHSELVQDGYELRECMLAEGEPHTMKFEGRKGLKITGRSNVFNCDFPEGTIIEDCAWAGVHQASEPDNGEAEAQEKRETLIKEMLASYELTAREQVEAIDAKDLDAIDKAELESASLTAASEKVSVKPVPIGPVEEVNP